MRRQIWAILGALLCLLCLGSAALADGLTLYGDYGIVGGSGPFLSDTDVEMATVGAEYAGGQWLVGGWWSIDLGYDPELPPWMEFEQSTSALYLGYDFAKAADVRLAALAGYVQTNREFSIGWISFASEPTSIAVGLEAAKTWKSFTLSGMYLYGVANDYAASIFGYEFYTTDEVDFSYLGLKAAWNFSRTLGAYLAYRSTHWDINPWDLQLDSAGYALGLQVKF